MKIIKIGGFDERGCPTHWHLDLNPAIPQNKIDFVPAPDPVILLTKDGEVFVGGVEIVEWTEAAQRAKASKCYQSCRIIGSREIP